MSWLLGCGYVASDGLAKHPANGVHELYTRHFSTK